MHKLGRGLVALTLRPGTAALHVRGNEGEASADEKGTRHLAPTEAENAARHSNDEDPGKDLEGRRHPRNVPEGALRANRNDLGTVARSGLLTQPGVPIHRSGVPPPGPSSTEAETLQPSQQEPALPGSW